MQVKIDFTSKKGKKKFANLIVALAILNINIFTAGLFWLAFNNMYLSDTAITCFFSFWGIEILSLASIKRSKVKYNQTFELNQEAQAEENEEIIFK